MRAFESYTLTLEALALSQARANSQVQIDELATALNGGPAEELRRLISLKERRKKGAFFTSSNLACQAVDGMPCGSSGGAAYLDPACGAGDLLLACARLLPLGGDLETTLDMWGERLIGYDLHSEFVRATKARLVLAAIARGAKTSKRGQLDLQKVFPQVTVGDARKQLVAIQTASHIVINPPFYRTNAPAGCVWGSGRVSMAAAMVDACLTHAQPGTRVVAILPDVLRSGGRYRNWRKHVASKASIDRIDVVGQFDSWADVDVFICHLTAGHIGDSTGNWWKAQSKLRPRQCTVGDLFEVHVGAVVPHRDPKAGRTYAYVHAHGFPTWETVDNVLERRKFTGTVFSPPFVVVRRTSRPGDAHRAVGTIVNIRMPVAVENHLLVLQPKDSTIRSCRQLLEVLHMRNTNRWLNRRIRCRHLTVDSLRELPWWRNSK